MIHTGDTVEDFELKDQTGTSRRLSELLSGGPVVLFFYPAAMTFGCTKESCHFRDLSAEFEAVGAVRVGISVDSVDKQSQFTSEQGLDYPLLSDPEKKVAKQFGVAQGFRLGPVRRTTFVIGQDRIVLAVIHSEFRFGSHADGALEVLRQATHAKSD